MSDDWFDEFMVEVRAKVAAHRWMVLAVGADDEHPSYSYTVGLYAEFGHPELVVIGLPPSVAHYILNETGYKIRDGFPVEIGKLYDDVLANDYKIRFIEVERDAMTSHVGVMRHYYQSDEVPILQLLWPDENGVFPTEEGCNLVYQPVWSSQR